MKNLDDNPTSNWGMTDEQLVEMQRQYKERETKKKFGLPERAIVHPNPVAPIEQTPIQSQSQSESRAPLMEETLNRQREMRTLNERAQKLSGKKFDQEKPRMDLLPPKALNEVAAVLSYGADKYGDHNWRSGLKWSRLIGASLRHITAWISGEHRDPESGFNHLAHAACNLLMLIECVELHLGEDDRWQE